MSDCIESVRSENEVLRKQVLELSAQAEKMQEEAAIIFEEANMNSLDKMEDYDRLQKENAELRAQLASASKRIEEAEKQEPKAFIIDWEGSRKLMFTNPKIGADTKPLYAKPIPPADVAELQRNYAEAQEECTALRMGWEAETQKRAKLLGKLAEQQALLSAENRGLIINGLILERERSLSRKKVNSESNSDIIADGCAALISAMMNYPDSHEELQKLLSQEREKAVPEGWQLIPIDSTPEILKAMRDAIALAKRISSDEATLAYGAIFPAAPSPASLNEKEGGE